MKLIVGLGNPGEKYNNTRHNVGFIYIDKFASKNGFKFKDKFQSLYAKESILGEEVILLKPQLFINLSGNPIKQVVNFFDLEIDDVLVIQDDLDQQFSKIKLKYDSSSGGHNGIKDIIKCLKTQKFFRLKFGIKNEYKKDVKDFVLSKFSKEELKIIDEKYNSVEVTIFNFIRSKNHNEFLKLQNKSNL